MKILLLEDDNSLNNIIKQVLERDGHHVNTFFSGNDVLEDEDIYIYDIYIMDINVPKMSGLELLDIIYSYNPLSKIIIISADMEFETISKAYSLGCIDYIKKPFYKEEVLFKINQYKNHKEYLLTTVSLRDREYLTKKERLFLELLLENRGKLITYSMIENMVYQDKTVSLSTIRTLVKRVRKKLSKDVIQNIKEEGYLIL
jgi:DNA-binding response OmpR family regulator